MFLSILAGERYTRPIGRGCIGTTATCAYDDMSAMCDSLLVFSAGRGKQSKSLVCRLEEDYAMYCWYALRVGENGSELMGCLVEEGE